MRDFSEVKGKLGQGNGVDVLEPTRKRLDEYGYAWGSGLYVLTTSDIDALKEGKVIAFQTGEYNYFLILDE